LNTYLFIGILVGIFALVVSFMLGNAISSSDAGNEHMQEIAGHIHEGAMAFLYREYRYLAIFIVVVFAIIAIFLMFKPVFALWVAQYFPSWPVSLGMRVATKANVRTAAAAEHGMSGALKIAFSGGSVMGLSVVSLGVIGVCFWYFVFDHNIDIVTGFGLGASSIALFARVGGGIYTKLPMLVLTWLVRLKPVSLKMTLVTLLLLPIT